ncbi:hypothetical protein [Hyalangium versicolor]|uniref:hypothetical protein n=1 Tax=Hyalangium versicolor TaxID=2861190 RepID=UPI001CCC08D5|nr:hypothetical protein [Hyalangium versicolor]
MNAIRIVALSVLLAAGGSLAEGKKKTAEQPKTPEPVLTEADKPKTCTDQCEMMEKLMVEPCKKGANSANKQARQMCSDQAKQVVDACYGSCKDKGQVDKQYIMERIKMPAGYKPESGGSGGDDAH